VGRPVHIGRLPSCMWTVCAWRRSTAAASGLPYGVDNERRRQRIAGLYQDDRDQAVRCSHENPEVVRLYRDFLGQPNGQKAHELFHTRYTARPLYKR